MSAEPPVPPRADSRAVSRPEPLVRLLSFKPAPRAGSTLFGYASVAFGVLVINDVPIFRTPDGGLSVGVPTAAEIGQDGRQREQDGRKKYRQVLGFLSPEGRSNYEHGVLRALATGGIGVAP